MSQIDAQNKMQALELEKQALAKKLAAQVESTKNAEKDMRLMYTRHKKQMQVCVCVCVCARGCITDVFLLATAYA